MKGSKIDMKKFFIAPSILSANFAYLGKEVEEVTQAGADIIHIDVMDNYFIKNLTFGPIICKSLKEYGINIPISIHLMAKPTEKLILDFIYSGANYIIIHVESCKHIDYTIKLIKESNCKVGLAFNPATPLNYLEYTINKLDVILIMSVNPGLGGEKFIPIILKKIKKAKKIINKSGRKIRLEIDGGVNLHNIIEIADSGADTFVMGSSIFNKKKNYKEIIKKINHKLNQIKK